MISLSVKFKRHLLFVSVAVIAIMSRGILLAFWLNSPFRYYSTVNGLDMQTLLAMAVKFYKGETFFSLYNLLVASTMMFNHGKVSFTAIIVIQQLLGVGISLLTAWLCLKLTGKKIVALGAGIISALYAPALIYEAITLRENLFAFTAVLALAVLIKLHQHHFSAIWLFLTGIIITLPFTVRLSALLWLGVTACWIILMIIKRTYPLSLTKFTCKLCGSPPTVSSKVKEPTLQSQGIKHHPIYKIFKQTSILMSGVLLVILVVATINFSSKKAVTSISKRYIKYIFTMGRQINPKTVNIRVPGDEKLTKEALKKGEKQPDSASASGMAYVNNCLTKLGKLFCQYEIPNNINYYFMREYLFPCSILPGPSMIIPLAVAGLILMLLGGRLLHRELLLMLYIGSFAVPIMLFLPLGRYRLIFYPIFSIAMFYPLQLIFIYLKTIKTKKIVSSLKIGGIIIMIGTIYIITRPENTRFRSSDFITYGKAYQQLEGDSDNTENCFATAYKLNPTSPPVAINYTNILLKRKKIKQALNAIAPAWQQHPKNVGVALFASSALLCNNMPHKAELILLKAGEPPELKGRRLYYYNLAACYRLQGKRQQAARAYAKFKKISKQPID